MAVKEATKTASPCDPSDLPRQAVAPRHCVRAFAAYEPHVLWQEPFLAARWTCYEQNGHPLAASALRQLEKYYATSPRPLFNPIRDAPSVDRVEEMMKKQD